MSTTENGIYQTVCCVACTSRRKRQEYLWNLVWFLENNFREPGSWKITFGSHNFGSDFTFYYLSWKYSFAFISPVLSHALDELVVSYPWSPVLSPLQSGYICRHIGWEDVSAHCRAAGPFFEAATNDRKPDSCCEGQILESSRESLLFCMTGFPPQTIWVKNKKRLRKPGNFGYLCSF